MALHTRGYEPPDASNQPGLCGLRWQSLWLCGAGTASPATEPKSPGTCKHQSSRWRCHVGGSLTFMWIWWDPSLSPRMGTATCSPWWTDPPGDQRPFLYAPHQRRPAWRPSSVGGWPALLCQRTSNQIGGSSSLNPCGLVFARSWASLTTPAGTGLGVPAALGPVGVEVSTEGEG
jgi:hypothetical protein